MQTQKGSATTIAFIILLFTLGGTAVYFKSFPLEKLPVWELQKTETKTQVIKKTVADNLLVSPTPPVTQPTLSEQKQVSGAESNLQAKSGWKIFRSERHKIEFLYPINYSAGVKETVDGLILEGDKINKGQAKMRVGIDTEIARGLSDQEFEGEVYKIVAWANAFKKEHLINTASDPVTFHFFKERPEIKQVYEDVIIRHKITKEKTVMFIIEYPSNIQFPTKEIIESVRFH